MSYKIECWVNLTKTDKLTNIRLLENDRLDWVGKNVTVGQSVVISFIDKNGYIVATSDSNDNFPQIGLDFLWSYIHSDNFNYSSPMRVYVKVTDTYPIDYPPLVILQSISDNPSSLFCDNVVLRRNGDVYVSPCDEKEYTEKDVITMLSYSVANDKITSKEMKQKVQEVLNWFKEHRDI
jgi:hypothetical protein